MADPLSRSRLRVPEGRVGVGYAGLESCPCLSCNWCQSDAMSRAKPGWRSNSACSHVANAAIWLPGWAMNRCHSERDAGSRPQRSPTVVNSGWSPVRASSASSWATAPGSGSGKGSEGMAGSRWCRQRRGKIPATSDRCVSDKPAGRGGVPKPCRPCKPTVRPTM